jgi:hypothetical protein
VYAAHGSMKHVPTMVVSFVRSRCQCIAMHWSNNCNCLHCITVFCIAPLLMGHFLKMILSLKGTMFSCLYFLVDGIYPPLSRFVRPINVPTGKDECLFTAWQESCQKDVERFFGVLKKNSLPEWHSNMGSATSNTNNLLLYHHS